MCRVRKLPRKLPLQVRGCTVDDGIASVAAIRIVHHIIS